jgi:hypothetical protein
LASAERLSWSTLRKACKSASACAAAGVATGLGALDGAADAKLGDELEAAEAADAALGATAVPVGFNVALGTKLELGLTALALALAATEVLGCATVLVKAVSFVFELPAVVELQATSHTHTGTDAPFKPLKESREVSTSPNYHSAGKPRIARSRERCFGDAFGLFTARKLH